jgi:hypothetical protein
MPAKTTDPLAQMRKELELQREDRAARHVQDIAHLEAAIGVLTTAATGAMLGIQQTRLLGIELMSAKATAFAKSYAAMTEAGLPAAAAYETCSGIYGLSSNLDSLVNDAARELAQEVRAQARRTGGLEKTVASLAAAMEEANARHATVAAGFDEDDDEDDDETCWVGGDVNKHS